MAILYMLDHCQEMCRKTVLLVKTTIDADKTCIFIKLASWKAGTSTNGRR
jgi:hypothetical protein